MCAFRAWATRRPGDLRQHVGADRLVRNFAADVFFDVRQRNGVFLAREADRIAFGARASGATDAVDVVCAVLRQVEVEDVTDFRNMQAARGDVGGDQHGELAIMELLQKAHALFLRNIA